MCVCENSKKILYEKVLGALRSEQLLKYNYEY